MATQDTELIVVDIGGGGGGKEPPAGGDGGGDGDRGRRRRKPPQRRYSTAITLGMISILMFFLGLCVAFLVLKRVSQAWVPLQLPKILWLNSASCGALPQFSASCFWPASWWLGCNSLRPAYTSQAIKPPAFSIFLPPPTACIWLAGLPPCCTWLRATLKRVRSHAPQRWKLLRTTGISWTACGCFCCCCSIWEDERPLVAHKLGHRFRDARQLSRPQLWIHRQRQNFLRSMLGVRKVTGLVSERSV